MFKKLLNWITSLFQSDPVEEFGVTFTGWNKDVMDPRDQIFRGKK